MAQDNGIDTAITDAEIRYIIKSFENNTPGESRINKLILKNTPDIGINKLKNIFNHALSMGYFPDKFKTAIIKSIPKTKHGPH